MFAKLKHLWSGVRRLSGDDAYERYLAHYAEHHPADTSSGESLMEPPLSKEAFFKQWQDSQWKGVNRCC